MKGEDEMASAAPTTVAPPRTAPRRAAPAPPPEHSALPLPATVPGIRKAGTGMSSPRILLAAVEGWGKTTMGSYAPSPIFLMARGETGLDTLRDQRLIPEVSSFEVLDSWPAVLASVDYLTSTDTGHQTAVFDALGGFERLCHEHVCLTQFRGEWGEKGFASFQKGYELSVNEWLKLLERLDRLRSARGMCVLLLSHCKIKTFKNPEGPDFDRYVADCHEKTWGITHKWADAVLFGRFRTIVTEEKGRKRGIGGGDRVIYTQHSDVRDAKNRFGMPEEIDIPSAPSESWSTLAPYLTAKGGA